MRICFFYASHVTLENVLQLYLMCHQQDIPPQGREVSLVNATRDDISFIKIETFFLLACPLVSEIVIYPCKLRPSCTHWIYLGYMGRGGGIGSVNELDDGNLMMNT